jgi:predicted transcriptional regulator
MLGLGPDGLAEPLIADKVTKMINSNLPVVTVETIMTGTVFSVHVSMTIREAIQVLVTNKISGSPVLDSSGTVVSVVSEGSLLKLATTKGTSVTIGVCLPELPTGNQLITARRTDSIQAIYKSFLTHSVHRIIVVDDTLKLLGIVSRSNILRMLVQAG